MGAISNRKNIADDALDFFTEGVGSLADIPGSMLDQLADSVGLGFIVRPAAYTGGFALGAVGGQETLKVKVMIGQSINMCVTIRELIIMYLHYSGVSMRSSLQTLR